MLRGTVVRDVRELEAWLDGWDRLAVGSARPFSSPAWMLSWWEAAAGPEYALRTVLVRDDGNLVGLVPLFAERAYGGAVRYRPLASPVSYRTEPLSVPGREREVAAAAAEVLAGERPRPELIALDAVPDGSPWAWGLAAGWPGPGRPWVHRDKALPAPVVSLEGTTFEDWFGSKSRNFRQQMRRARRKLEELGATFRAATVDELPGAVADFARLHRARWDWRGGPNVFTDDVGRMLEAAGRRMVPDRRMRLWTIELGGRAISSHLFLAAGGEVSYWLGGFDEEYAEHHPGMLSILDALEEAWGLGDRRMDLGGGPQPYKYRFSSSEDTLAWWSVVPKGPGYARTRARLIPKQAYRAVADRLSDDAKERVRKVVRIRSGWVR